MGVVVSAWAVGARDLPQYFSLAPGNHPGITAQSPVITSDLFALLGN